MELKMRRGRIEDTEASYELEMKTFPEEEAASKEGIEIRLREYSEGFLVGEIEGEIVAHINGGATNKDDITDEEFKKLIGHKKNGLNAVIFSLAVDPKHQRKGIASLMMKRYIEISKEMDKKKVLLLCKKELIEMYESMGYKKIGISASEHGGATWYEMEYSLV